MVSKLLVYQVTVKRIILFFKVYLPFRIEFVSLIGPQNSPICFISSCLVPIVLFILLPKFS